MTNEKENLMNALILYDSTGGNTEKIANAIYETTVQAIPSKIVKVDKNTSVELLEHDLIFIGSPVIDWLPIRTMMNYVRRSMTTYNARGLVQPAAPIRPGKFGVSFGTFAGPHIGKREAFPMNMWLNCALEHIGYLTIDSWLVVGQFNTMKELNKGGRMGDIQNRPNEHDLNDIRNRTSGVIASLDAWLQ